MSDRAKITSSDTALEVKADVMNLTVTVHVYQFTIAAKHGKKKERHHKETTQQMMPSSQRH